MKKRIISLILVAVMAVLTLASCAYSYADDDMTQYATFNKQAFLDAIKEFEIEDSDFTEDADTRANKVLDKIYTTLAGKADTSDEKNEGTVGANDLFYYCYYVTANIDGTEYIFQTENMKVLEIAKMSKVQLGLNYYDTDLLEKLAAAFKDFEFSADSVYEQVTEGKPTNGQVVYLSYVRTYKNTTSEGVTEEVQETASAHRVVLDEANPFHKYLLANAEIGTAVSGTVDIGDTYKDDPLYEQTKGAYTSVKIDWAEKGNEAEVVVDVTYTAEKNLQTTIYTGTTKTKNLKDVELSYHIYPVSYVQMPAYNATTLINDVYGESITLTTLATILFGTDYTEGEEDAVEALLDQYKFTVKEAEISLEDFVTKLDEAQTEFGDAKEALDTAKTKYEEAEEAKTEADADVVKAETALKEAQDAYSADPTDANKTALDEAEKEKAEAEKEQTAAANTLKNAKETYLGKEEDENDKGAQGTYDEALAERDALVTELIATVTEEKILEGYEYNITYKNLETTYNAEIKEKIASFVYEQIVKNVTVTSYPEKAVDKAYDYLIENYEYCFYENITVSGSSNSSTSDSFYKQYGGSFKNFLVEYAVPEDLGTDVETYDEALAAVRKEAERHVGEMVTINIVAQALDLTLTDDEYETLTEEDSNYLYYGESYGEDAFRAAYQFNKVLNAILESEEKEEGKATLVSYANDYITKITLVEELAEEEETETETE